MQGNVIQLPRPRATRSMLPRMGLYLRVGWNQHLDLLEVLAAGERNFHGIVVDAGSVERRHGELCSYALQTGLDVALDPKTHPMALPGGYSSSMAELPWGLDRPHNIADFEGKLGRDIALQITEFAQEHRFTQILGPTHLLSGANDRWLRHDIENMGHMRSALDASQSSIELIYPLALPIKALRDPLERAALIAALGDAPMDAIWLRIENYGSDATGEKTVAYVQAAREFHARGVPVIADHVGGLNGLGLLAFGAVGGLSQGITLFEGFKAHHWRRPPQEGRNGGMPATRVYIPKLDTHLKRADAEAFLRSSTRARGKYGCGDTHCCPGGIRDMLDNPTRHLVHQRSSEVGRIAEFPSSIRVKQYLERFVRPVADDVSAAAGLGAISDELRTKLGKKQKAIGLFRQAVDHFAEVDTMKTMSRKPLTRLERQESK